MKRERERERGRTIHPPSRLVLRGSVTPYRQDKGTRHAISIHMRLSATQQTAARSLSSRGGRAAPFLSVHTRTIRDPFLFQRIKQNRTLPQSFCFLIWRPSDSEGGKPKNYNESSP